MPNCVKENMWYVSPGFVGTQPESNQYGSKIIESTTVVWGRIETKALVLIILVSY